MDPPKILAVVNWPTLDYRKALQRCLGFANFCRRFIRIRSFDSLDLHQNSFQVVQTQEMLRFPNSRAASFLLLFLLSLTLLVSLWWRSTHQRLWLARFFPSVLLRMTRCILAHIFLINCILLNAIMTLVKESCWQSSSPWRNGVIDWRVQGRPQESCIHQIRQKVKLQAGSLGFIFQPFLAAIYGS